MILQEQEGVPRPLFNSGAKIQNARGKNVIVGERGSDTLPTTNRLPSSLLSRGRGSRRRIPISSLAHLMPLALEVILPQQDKNGEKGE